MSPPLPSSLHADISPSSVWHSRAHGQFLEVSKITRPHKDHRLTPIVVTLAEAAAKFTIGSSVAGQVRPKRYYKIPKETLEATLDDVEQLINFFVIEAQRIVFAENIPNTAVVSPPRSWCLHSTNIRRLSPPPSSATTSSSSSQLGVSPCSPPLSHFWCPWFIPRTKS